MVCLFSQPATAWCAAARYSVVWRLPASATKNRRGGTPQVFRHVGLLFSETLGVAEVLSIQSSDEFNPSPGTVAIQNHTSPDPRNHTARDRRNKWGQGPNLNSANPLQRFASKPGRSREALKFLTLSLSFSLFTNRFHCS